MKGFFTSESVSEGHPDKICDLVADTILDAYLEKDPDSRVAIEVLCKGGHLVLGGEIHSGGEVDREAVARGAVRSAGYNYDDLLFHGDRIEVLDLVGTQSWRLPRSGGRRDKMVEAADQGIVFGFATRETESLMPLPITLAHAITKEISNKRRSGEGDFLRPDAKSQVTLSYDEGEAVGVDTVIVSAQHEKGTDRRRVEELIREAVLPQALGPWLNPGTRILVNPAGAFDIGGPEADCGVTGRKTSVDTYGGMARHGGGAFSGKDGTKVDRSGAYQARYVARQIVLRGLAERVEVQVAYAIGVAEALTISVDTMGTGDDAMATAYAQRYDFRPGDIIRQLGLDTPIFSATTNYGHFGRKGFSWEK
jgi:S-adenosylmethionine synthetase